VISITMSRVSRATLMAAGLLLVAAGTVIAASAPTLEVFTLGRVVAAFGGAALVPTATAAAAMMASPERRGRADRLRRRRVHGRNRTRRPARHGNCRGRRLADADVRIAVLAVLNAGSGRAVSARRAA